MMVFLMHRWSFLVPHFAKKIRAWQRNKDLAESPVQEGVILQDIESNCKAWAEAGECEKNEGFMVGTSGSGIGHCRLSCKACEVCSKGNRACLNRNRVKDGFLPLEVLD